MLWSVWFTQCDWWNGGRRREIFPAGAWGIRGWSCLRCGQWTGKTGGRRFVEWLWWGFPGCRKGVFWSCERKCSAEQQQHESRMRTSQGLEWQGYLLQKCIYKTGPDWDIQNLCLLKDSWWWNYLNLFFIRISTLIHIAEKEKQLKIFRFRAACYAGGGGLPRTEQQPAGLIAPLLCRVVLFDPLTRRR